jgi:biopolymer transport protein ExbD
MTPMIDIVFLLIIFFMTVSQITHVTDHPMALPRVTEGDQAPKTATVTINLIESGEIIIAGTKLSLDDTLSAMRRQLKKFDDDPSRILVQMRSDRNCECRHINELLQSLKELGFKQVRSAVTNF